MKTNILPSYAERVREAIFSYCLDEELLLEAEYFYERLFIEVTTQFIVYILEKRKNARAPDGSPSVKLTTLEVFTIRESVRFLITQSKGFFLS